LATGAFPSLICFQFRNQLLLIRDFLKVWV